MVGWYSCALAIYKPQEEPDVVFTPVAYKPATRERQSDISPAVSIISNHMHRLVLHTLQY